MSLWLLSTAGIILAVLGALVTGQPLLALILGVPSLALLALLVAFPHRSMGAASRLGDVPAARVRLPRWWKL